MEKSVCSACQKPKATLACGACASSLCKACALSLNEGDFSLLEVLPTPLAHPFYCPTCYDATVAPALGEYEETLERAKGVFVFTKDMGKEARLIKRKEAVIRTEECTDYDEAIMKLAYQAAAAGHNAMVDVEISDRKVREGGYQTTIYSGRGIPATVDPRRYEDRPQLSNPN